MNFCLSAGGIGLPDNEPRSDPTAVNPTLIPDWIHNRGRASFAKSIFDKISHWAYNIQDQLLQKPLPTAKEIRRNPRITPVA